MDCELFKHKLLLRSVLPASLDSSFKCLRFNVIDSRKAASSLYTVVEAICWKVSRKTNISCFCTTFSGLTICLIYHIAQGNILDYAVAELQRRLHVELDSSMEQEQNVSSSALLVPAVESTMMSAMLNQGWSFLENGVILNCNVAAVEEEQSLEAVSVSLQVEGDNSIRCILAPDVIRIFRLKIFNQLPLEKKQEFDGGKEVNLEEWSWGFNNDERERCVVLPFLVEGFVIGLCKLPPKAKDYKELIKLWKNKHGLHLSQDCYYVKVEYTYEEESHKHWFPSSIVIRRCGLKPVLQTIRSIKVVKAYESFRSSISGWNFFDLGPLEFQDLRKLNFLQKAWRLVAIQGKQPKEKKVLEKLSGNCSRYDALQRMPSKSFIERRRRV